MRAAALLAVLAALATAAPAAAQRNSHRDVIMRQLDTLVVEKRDEGFQVDSRPLGDGTLVGLLPADGYVMVELALRAGTEYFIVGGCDTDCDDLDLRAHTPDNTLLDEDVSADDVPIVSFVPRASGPHLLTVSMASCKTDNCYFGVRVFSRPSR